MATPNPEAVFELYRMIGESTGDMWAIAIGLSAAEVLIICHLLYERTAGQSSTRLAWFIVAAGLCNIVSIASGALAKFSMISALKHLAAGNTWNFEITTEVLNAIQLIALILGILFFVGLFVVYSKVIAQIIVKLKAS